MLPVPKRPVTLLQFTLPRDVRVTCAVALACHTLGSACEAANPFCCAGLTSSGRRAVVSLCSANLRVSAALRLRNHPLKLHWHTSNICHAHAGIAFVSALASSLLGLGPGPMNSRCQFSHAAAEPFFELAGLHLKHYHVAPSNGRQGAVFFGVLRISGRKLLLNFES